MRRSPERGYTTLAPAVGPRMLPARDNRIVSDPAICSGKPVIRGTRITAQTIIEFLAAGDSVEDVLEEYPAITREDVQACLVYASRLLANNYSLVFQIINS